MKKGIEAGSGQVMSEIPRVQPPEVEALGSTVELLRRLKEACDDETEFVPFTNQEKRDLLTSEVLVNLTTEEYMAVWRKLNPYFLAHTTRQGFRDHFEMDEHTDGMETFHHGFNNILEGGRNLLPSIALRHGLRTRGKDSVLKFVDSEILEAKDETEAHKRLHEKLNSTSASAANYPDETAVHFSVQEVSNLYYGSEGGNEIFLVYPTDAIVSQYDFSFNGGQTDLTKPGGEQKWNDVFVWPTSPNDPCIPVDAGFVFLPESTRVDPRTGSKYASETRIIDGKEQRLMIEDETLINAFNAWASTGREKSLVVSMIAEYRNSGNSTRNNVKEKCLGLLQKEMEDIGFGEEAALPLADKIFVELIWEDEIPDKRARWILKESTALWKRADNSVSSKEYWEQYFIAHPDLRPAHIVFYDGDPTSAITKFQRANNIGQRDVLPSGGLLLGFEDNYVENEKTDPRANRGYDELVKTSHEVIAEHFARKTIAGISS